MQLFNLIFINVQIQSHLVEFPFPLSSHPATGRMPMSLSMSTQALTLALIFLVCVDYDVYCNLCLGNERLERNIYNCYVRISKPSTMYIYLKPSNVQKSVRLYNFDCSTAFNFRKGGPPRLPSPTIRVASEFSTSLRSFHFSRISDGALFSKQSAT